MLDQYLLYRDYTEKWRTLVSSPSCCQNLEGGLVEGKVPGARIPSGYCQGTLEQQTEPPNA